MGKLDNKVAIITGASQGMGASHAKLFIKEGAKVVITDVKEDKGTELAKELGDNAMFAKQDVTSEDDWKNVIDQTVKKFGKLDILVNNAGITFAKPISDLTVDDYMKIVKVNQVSVFLGMKYASAEMKKNGHGSIVNISSIAGLVGTPNSIGYTDSKYAVRGMTKAAALEFAPYGIRVNSVHPGAIDTPMVHQDNIGSAVDEFISAIPLKRIGNPEEVSKMVLFVASDDSSYSTGSEFVVDGGSTAQ